MTQNQSINDVQLHHPLVIGLSWIKGESEAKKHSPIPASCSVLADVLFGQWQATHVHFKVASFKTHTK